MKKFFLTILLFISYVSYGQFTIPNGTVVGNQTVIPIPVNPPGFSTVQALLWLPDDYGTTTKRYPLYVFLHGAGEGSSNNITEVNNTSLPQLIAAGLKPYAIDTITGDTIKFIVVSPHCATCGGSYSFPQLQYTIPYLYSNYRVDTSCVFVGGLSSGGSCTWSMAMGNGGSGNGSASPNDTLITKRITGIMPMANGGYDNNITQSKLKANLDTTARRGLSTFYVIGDQDPGYNGSGFFTYDAEMTAYSQPGKYHPKVIVGGTHSANVWNLPFPLNARVWSTTRNSWTQMWHARKTIAVATLVADAGSDQTIALPTSSVTLNGSNSSTPGGTTITSYSWLKISGTGGTITSPSSINTTVTGLTQGTYKYSLTVINSASVTAKDTIQINVNAAAANPPIVNAGSSQSITLPTSTATITGSASGQGSNTISSTLWKQVTGPNTSTITTPSSLSTTLTGLIAGLYVFRLTAIDNLAQKDSSDVSVTVNASAPGGLIVTGMALTEYKGLWRYSDSSARTFYYNQTSGHVEFAPYAIGRKIIDAAPLFNLFKLLDDQHYMWTTIANSISATRIDTDTTGAPMNNVSKVFGYFYTGASIRSDGTIWYDGGDDYKFYYPAGGRVITHPVKLRQPNIAFKKLGMGNTLLGLAVNGDVYAWFKGDSNYHKVILPRPATDVGASQYDVNIIIVPDDTLVSKSGYPYAFGAGSGYWGGTGSPVYTAPVALKTLWNMTVPIRALAVNRNTIHYIDDNRRMFGIGDNQNTEIGDGSAPTLQWNYPTQYAASWNPLESPTGAPPIQIGVGINWDTLYGGAAYVFFKYAQDTNDSLYFWGRNKSFVGGDGAVNAQEGIYANAMDVKIPTLRTPLSVAPTATVSYNFTKGSTGAGTGSTQTVNGSTATFTIADTATSLVASGHPNYGYTVTGHVTSQISGPTTASITGSTTTTPAISGMTVPGVYVFRIITTDTQGATYSSTVSITANPASAPCNCVQTPNIHIIIKKP